MADVITDDLAELAAHEIVAQPGSTDAFGDWTASGAPQALPCYISTKGVSIRDAANQEVLASVKVIVFTNDPLLNQEGYRFQLPAGFPQADDDELKALKVQFVSDENGVHHQVLYFP